MATVAPPPEVTVEGSPTPMRERVERFWTRRLGLSPAEWSPERPALVRCQRAATLSALTLTGRTALVGPPEVLDRLAARGYTSARWPASLHDARRLAALAEVAAEQAVGSAMLSYADEATLRPPPMPLHLERLEAAPDLGGLLAACEPRERSESGLAEVGGPWFVLRDPEREIVGAAGTQPWDDDLAHFGVLLHPRWRGQGVATSLAAAAAGAALDRGLLPQWRASTGNAASQAVARRLGFVTLGWQTTVRVPAATAPVRG